MPKAIRAVLTGDMHVGGVVSLADPSVTRADQWSVVREQLFHWWTEAATGPWANPDLLVLNGDLTEGVNRKENALGLWAQDPDDQVRHAVELTEMWGAKQKVVTRGSGYHGKVGNIPVEEHFAREAKAMPYPNQPKGKERMHSGHQWYLTLNGRTFHIQHHVPVSKVWHYRTTPLARELLYSKVNDALRYDPGGFKTTVTVRSHAHYFNYVEYGSTRGWVLPCWKGLDEFLLSRGGVAISPDIGFVGVEISPEGEIYFEKHLWPIELAQKPPHVVIGGPPRGGKRQRSRAGRPAGKR